MLQFAFKSMQNVAICIKMKYSPLPWGEGWLRPSPGKRPVQSNPTGRHHRRHLYQRGHRQPRRRGGRFARDMRHTVAPIVVRLQRLGAVAGAGAGARVRTGCRDAARCHGSDAGCCDVPKNAMRSAAMGLHIEAQSPGPSQGSRTTDTQAAPTKSHLHRLGWGWGLGLGLGLGLVIE